MKKRYDYYWVRIATQLTGIVFLTQILAEVSGIVQRKPGFEWVLPTCGAAFALAMLYAVVLIVLNALHERNGA
jgi:hypothetical protein